MKREEEEKKRMKGEWEKLKYSICRNCRGRRGCRGDVQKPWNGF
jgi:hypothetical protein